MSTLASTPRGSGVAPRWRPAARRRLASASCVLHWAFTVWLGLWVTPPDAGAGQPGPAPLHPPADGHGRPVLGGRRRAARAASSTCGRRTRSFFWDRLAASSVEVGVVFSALTLVTGSLWGRPAWGVWWTWDARLTSTALLLLLELGYLALRRVPADPARPGPALRRGRAPRRRRRAHRALLGRLVADAAPGRHHPRPRLPPARPRLHGLDDAARLRRVLPRLRLDAGVRYRIEVLQDAVGDEELEVSLAERWSEGRPRSGRRGGAVRATPRGRVPP